MTEIKVFWEAHSQGASLGSFIGPMSYAESTPRRRPWSPFISPSPACGGGQGGWWTSVQRLAPLPPLAISGARAFIDRRKGLHGEIAQSALTVIFRLVIGGLTRVILIVLGTVNFQFPGALVPISLRPILGIMAASGSSVQEVAESQRPPSNWAQHSHRIRSLGNWSPLGCKATTLT